MASSPRISGPIIYFYNGINNSREDAQELTNHLKALTNVSCYLRYNDAASPTILKSLGVDLICKVADVSSSEDVFCTRFLKASAAIITTAKPTFEGIQKRKNELAIEEAEKVIKYLNSNPLIHLIFVGHSQGGDVVTRILDRLAEIIPKFPNKNLIDRISAITIGGLEIVHCNQIRSGRKFNLIHEDDYVIDKFACLYKRFFFPTREICHETCQVTMSGTGGHSAVAYFKNKLFIKHIKKYCQISLLKVNQPIETPPQIDKLLGIVGTKLDCIDMLMPSCTTHSDIIKFNIKYRFNEASKLNENIKKQLSYIENTLAYHGVKVRQVRFNDRLIKIQSRITDIINRTRTCVSDRMKGFQDTTFQDESSTTGRYTSDAGVVRDLRFQGSTAFSLTNASTVIRTHVQSTAHIPPRAMVPVFPAAQSSVTLASMNLGRLRDHDPLESKDSVSSDSHSENFENQNNSTLETLEELLDWLL